MSYWFKGIVLILVLELFIPSTRFKISDYFKEFICMKNTGETRSMCKKENKGLVEQKIQNTDFFDKIMKEINNKKQ
jgi:hypothetical protein